jgi:serine/threonine protein phosphatase PrpC
VTAASQRGSAHQGEVPNQDAARTARLTASSGADCLVAAVSDGHGGARYVRSDVGSNAAVDIAVTHLQAVLQDSDGFSPVDVLRREVPGIVAAWRAEVAGHHADHPFTAAEVATAGGADLEAHPVLAYGATLLIAVISDDGVGLAQIGDGDALVRTSGFATRPVPGDDRLVASETTSLCLDTAVDDFRYGSLPGSAEADLVLLASDGYGNSFAEADWWHHLVGDLAWFLTEHDFSEFEALFPSWLAESALVGGDDVTAVVMARQPLVDVPVAPAVSATPPAIRTLILDEPADETVDDRAPVPLHVDPDDEPPVLDPDHALPSGTPPDSGGRRRLLLLLGIAAALIVVAVIVVLLVLRGAGDGSNDPATPTPTPSVSTGTTVGTGDKGGAPGGSSRPDRPRRDQPAR